MFLLLLFINAVTDAATGYVYDCFAAALALSGIMSGEPGDSLGILTILGLSILLLADRDERYLGQGDYLIIIALSMYLNEGFPLMLIIASGLCLLAMTARGKRSQPLVPYLFMGTVITEIISK